MASTDEEALIAGVQHAFAQDVKSRSGAAEIQTSIAANVASYTVVDERDEALPTQIKSPGKEVTGLRRRYVDALKANLEARERYQESNIERRDRAFSQLRRPILTGSAVLLHLEFLRLRRQYQELAIRNHYVHSLTQDASASCDLELPQSKQRNGVEDDNTQDMQNDTAAVEAEVKSLTSELQKAILQANHQLKRQKALMAQVKHAQASADSGLTGSHSCAKAVAATREVLVAWLDEKLSESGAEHVEKPNVVHTESNGVSKVPPLSIAVYYQRYLDARKATIEAADEAMRPLAALPNKHADKVERILVEPNPTSDDLSIVHTITQHIAPQLRQEAGMATLQSYLSAQKARERSDTLEILERLAHESHLLSTYPAGRLDAEDELARSVAAWTSAAQAASDSASKAAEQHERKIRQALAKGEENLNELKSSNDGYERSSRINEGIDWKGMHGRLENDDT